MNEMGGDQAQARLIARLRACASRERAEKEKAYHKSVWDHWGVSMPKMDAAIRETLKGAPDEVLFQLSGRLWSEPVWDLKIAAVRVLARNAVPPSKRMWRFVLARMGDLDGWAVADNLADVGSRCLVDDPLRLDAVETWIDSGHLWTRRAALVFTLPWAKPGRNPERTLGWAARLRDDREWFIQKAIGWWLRELSKHNPARVRRFLHDHGTALKGVARREASKYCPG